MASNKSGFDNENSLILSLNNKEFNELNENLQNLIKSSFTNYNGKILCEKKAGLNKSDIEIKIDKEVYTYSIKKGTGNSVHQEPIEGFLLFLEKYYTITQELKDNIRFFIWGDGTLDGTGNIKNRLSASKLKKEYPEKINMIQSFFNGIKRDLIKRFVIDGVNSSNISSDYIYYGNVESGICSSSNKVLDWLEKYSSNGAISVGRLTFQAWNRNLNGGYKSEKKRGVIQLKWGTIKDDIEAIANE